MRGNALFFQLVNARYEKGAMILTSNRGFAEWGEVCGDPVVRIPRKMGIDSTRSWARIPRYRGRPFHASGGLADWVMESVLAGRVKRFGCGSPLPHAFSGECQAVSVMNEAVEDRVGECRVADGLVPVLDRQLAGDDRRAAAVSIFEDFEQVAPFG